MSVNHLIIKPLALAVLSASLTEDIRWAIMMAVVSFRF
jgi:hypothetical protein